MSNWLVVPFAAGSVVWMVSSYVILTNTTALSQWACVAIAVGITIVVDGITLFGMAKFARNTEKTKEN